MRVAKKNSVSLKARFLAQLLLAKIWINKSFRIWQLDVLPIRNLSHFSGIFSRFATVLIIKAYSFFCGRVYDE